MARRAIGALVSALPGERPWPKMVRIKPFFRHPDVNEGEGIGHTFEILNEDNAALEIREVKPTANAP